MERTSRAGRDVVFVPYSGTFGTCSLTTSQNDNSFLFKSWNSTFNALIGKPSSKRMILSEIVEDTSRSSKFEFFNLAFALK